MNSQKQFVVEAIEDYTKGQIEVLGTFDDKEDAAFACAIMSKIDRRYIRVRRLIKEVKQ